MTSDSVQLKPALIPTWVPEGLFLRTMVEMLPVHRHVFDKKTLYRSADGLRCLEVTLQQPQLPHVQVFAESVELPNGMSAIVSRFAEYISVERFIGNTGITATGKGLTTDELAQVSSSVQIRFDEYGPHLTSIETGDLREQHFEPVENPLLLNYTSPDHKRSISLSTDNEPNTFGEVGVLFEREGCPWQVHAHKVEDIEVDRFIDGLRSATMAEFHQARMEAEPLNELGGGPWGRLGFLSGDDRLLNDIELRIRSTQHQRYGFPQHGSHEIFVTYRGGGSGFTTNPSATPTVHRGLYTNGLHLGLLLSMEPIVGARAIRYGVSEPLPAFSHQLAIDEQPIQVFAILRRDDQPPFQRVELFDEDGTIVHSVRDSSP
jgi:hypothetical protein